MEESTVTKSIHLPYNMTAARLGDWLLSVPRDAVITVQNTQDYGLGDPSLATVTATWKEWDHDAHR